MDQIARNTTEGGSSETSEVVTDLFWSTGTTDKRLDGVASSSSRRASTVRESMSEDRDRQPDDCHQSTASATKNIRTEFTPPESEETRQMREAGLPLTGDPRDRSLRNLDRRWAALVEKYGTPVTEWETHDIPSSDGAHPPDVIISFEDPNVESITGDGTYSHK